MWHTTHRTEIKNKQPSATALWPITWPDQIAKHGHRAGYHRAWSWYHLQWLGSFRLIQLLLRQRYECKDRSQLRICRICHFFTEVFTFLPWTQPLCQVRAPKDIGVWTAESWAYICGIWCDTGELKYVFCCRWHAFQCEILDITFDSMSCDPYGFPIHLIVCPKDFGV